MLRSLNFIECLRIENSRVSNVKLNAMCLIDRSLYEEPRDGMSVVYANWCVRNAERKFYQQRV